jgi:hypothetical protein
MGVAGHDDMHSIMERCDGEFVGRVQAGLRGDERPGPNTGVLGSSLKGGKECEQREFKN